VLDTVHSVFHYSTSFPHVVVAIDRARGDTRKQDAIERAVRAKFPQVLVYKAPRACGWGAGMYSMLCDTIQWAAKRLKFEHFLSLDYDALFIKEGADERHLVDARKQGVGLVASNNGPSRHWKHIFRQRWEKIKKLTKGKEPDPKHWKAGTSVLGSIMLITGPAMAAMRKVGYLAGSYRDIRGSLQISDDAWLRFLVALAGFSTISNRSYVYNVWSNPVHYTDVLKKTPDICVWHPTKMRAGGRSTNAAAEKACRNWFRSKRGKPPMK
jgi:hypothetical protein